MLTARALYSNVSESPDELSFNEGDVLAVLQKDVNGLSGWWLCLIDGRLGLAPGNRLKGNSARHVEPNGEDDMRPLEPELLRSADDSKRTHVVKGLQQSDSNDSRQIYDVPPTKNSSSSSLPRNTSGKSHEIVYDVPPSSSKTVSHDKPRKEVEFEYQDPRNQSYFSRHKTATTPGTANQQLRTVPSRDTTGPAETLPEKSSGGKNPSKNAAADGGIEAGGDGGRMGSVVRVCVEDDDDLSSEDTAVASTNASRSTGNAAEVEEETGRFPSAKRLTYDPRSTGKAATLPRRTVDGGTGQSEELIGTITNHQKPSHQRPVVRLSSSPISSGPSCTVSHLNTMKIHDERDPFTDNYYSVPAKWKTLPSPRYRHSSSSVGRQQLFRTEIGSVDRPSPPPQKDAARTRCSRSEAARPTGDDQEYQLSFVDTGILVECPPDPRSVSEMMESLQQTVRLRTGMIRDLCLGFDLSAAAAAAAGVDRRKNEADMTQMKACCASLRSALREFAELGTGVLANAMQSPSRDMSENILQQLEALDVYSQELGESVDAVVSASRGGEEPPARRGSTGANLRDAINSLLAITRDIAQPLDSLTYLVAKNSAVIFSAGRALPPPPRVPGFPAIMDIRSPSSPSLPALPGPAREFNFLPPNIPPTQALSPYSLVEMRPGSPNVLYIQNLSPGNLIHGRVARDGKTGAAIAVQSPDVFHSFPSYHSSSPTPTPLQALPPYFRPAASSVPPCYSNLPMVDRGLMVGTEPAERPGPKQYWQTRPFLPLPFEEEGVIVNRSNDDRIE